MAMKKHPLPSGATEIVLIIPKGALGSEQPTESDQVKISRITSTSRFAVELLIAARLMANKASTTAGEPNHELRSFVTAAVVLAYSFLEAGLNEFIYLNAQASETLSAADKTAIADIASQDLQREWRERKTTLELFNVILSTLNKDRIAKDRPPYAAAEAVRSLRNLLVHPKPVRVTTFSDNPNEDLSRQHKITTKLRDHLKLDRSATFPAQVLTAKCAAWAVSSSLAFFAEFVKRSGVNPGFLTDGRI
jgi:hypothetical protein